MTVEEMLEYSARAIFDAAEWRSDANAWESLSGPEQSEWKDAAYESLESLGLPLETLAALKAGAWRAVPVEPTEKMAAPLTRSWLLAEQEPTAEDMHLARQYAALMLAAAPTKPEDAE